jgi:hypothetical protein
MKGLMMKEYRLKLLAPTDVQAVEGLVQKHAASVLYYIPQQRDDATGNIQQHFELAISSPFQQVCCGGLGCWAAGWLLGGC